MIKINIDEAMDLYIDTKRDFADAPLYGYDVKKKKVHRNESINLQR